MIALRLLGPLEVVAGGAPVALGGPRQRAVLAYLAINAGRVISDDQLAEEIWDGSPPPSAEGTLRVYVSRLRKLLGGEGSPGHQVLVSRAGGYLLDEGSCELDVAVFEDRLGSATSALEAGAVSEAHRGAADALAQWRGPALLDFRYERFAQAEIGRLEERRLDALELRIEAELLQGRFREVTAELAALVETYPLREGLWAQLMRALYGSGRQSDALAAGQRLRRTLAEELGLDPGPQLVRLEQRILDHDPDLLVGVVAGSAAAPPAARFDRAGPEGRRMAQIASVLGEHCDVELFAAVSRAVGCPGDLDGLVAAGILEIPEASPERRRFTDVLLADAAKATMSPDEAERLHLASARAMATRARRQPGRWAAPVATQYLNAGGLAPHGESLPSFELAAAVSREHGEHDEARRWLQVLLRLRTTATGVEGPDGGLWLRLGQAAADAGDWGEARESFRRAVALSERSSVVFAESVLGLGGPWQSIEETDPEFERLAEEAIRHLPAGERSLKARLLGRVAVARACAGEHSAEQVASEARRQARRSSSPEAMAMALHALHVAGMTTLGWAERLVLAEEMLRCCVGAGLDVPAQVARTDRLSDLLEGGRLGDAARCLHSYDRTLARRGTALQRWWSAVAHATLAAAGGDLVGAERQAVAAAELGTPLNPADAISIYGAQLFTIRWAQGRLGELRPSLEKAVADQPEMAAWRAGLALACLSDGDATVASRHLAGLLLTDDIHHDRYGTPTLCVLAQVAADLGEEVAGSRLYELLAPHAGSFAVVGHGYAIFGPVDRFLGPLAVILGEDRAAAVHLQRARQAALRVGGLVWVDAVEGWITRLQGRELVDTKESI